MLIAICFELWMLLHANQNSKKTNKHEGIFSFNSKCEQWTRTYAPCLECKYYIHFNQFVYVWCSSWVLFLVFFLFVLSSLAFDFIAHFSRSLSLTLLFCIYSLHKNENHHHHPAKADGPIEEKKCNIILSYMCSMKCIHLHSVDNFFFSVVRSFIKEIAHFSSTYQYS